MREEELVKAFDKERAALIKDQEVLRYKDQHHTHTHPPPPKYIYSHICSYILIYILIYTHIHIHILPILPYGVTRNSLSVSSVLDTSDDPHDD